MRPLPILLAATPVALLWLTTVGAPPAQACHTYESPSDGKIGCIAFRRDKTTDRPEPTPAPEPTASDDTFACLQAGAPGTTGIVTVAGDQGWVRWKGRDLPPGTAIDARTARWSFDNLTMRQDYPIDLRNSPQFCWAGGTVVGTVPADASWEYIYHEEGGNGAALIFGDPNAPQSVVDGIRIHNAWDGIRPREETDGFLIKNVWLTHVRDDCIENDHYITGRLEDSLLDGCFSAVSSRSEDRPLGAVFTVQSSLIRLQAFPFDAEYPIAHGGFFKWDGGFGEPSTSPGLKIYDSIFMLDDVGKYDERPERLGIPNTLVDCARNTLVWLGDGPLPFELPSCFTVTTDRSVWERARQAWIDGHPKIARVSGVD